MIRLLLTTGAAASLFAFVPASAQEEGQPLPELRIPAPVPMQVQNEAPEADSEAADDFEPYDDEFDMSEMDDELVGEMAGLAMLGALFDAPELTAEQEARLPAAMQAVQTAFPDGVYKQLLDTMMGSEGMFGGLLGEVVGSAMSPGDLADALGRDELAMESLSQEERIRLTELLDPDYEERTQKTMDSVFDTIGDAMSSMEPALREGYAKAYATRFTQEQLTEINAFLATDTGAYFASQSILMSADPHVMQATMQALPTMMGALPELMIGLEGAVADLPEQKTYDALTVTERAEIAEMLGIELSQLEADMRRAENPPAISTMSLDEDEEELVDEDDI
ncbi:hypothetical protein [Qipengyuania sp. JC766]|uniref:hypothetical protein n=1 Tax=Qipengyuania sp. JC766 TaxID=3232139 RepID=UPI003459C2C8